MAQSGERRREGGRGEKEADAKKIMKCETTGKESNILDDNTLNMLPNNLEMERIQTEALSTFEAYQPSQNNIKTSNFPKFQSKWHYYY